MKKLFIIAAMALLAGGAMAQKNADAPCKQQKECPKQKKCCKDTKHRKGYYTKYYADAKLKAEAEAWVKSGEWRNGYTGAAPHESVNAVDFYLQYHKNPEQWKALFSFLANTDLLALPKGKQPIPGSNLTVSVEDSENGPLETRNSESHYHGIDFQFCVKGTERFGIIDHYTSTPKDAYRTDVIHYNYCKERTLFYDSTPDKFFLFFPGDWHIAKVDNGTDNNVIRVIVVKIAYKD